MDRPVGDDEDGAQYLSGASSNSLDNIKKLHSTGDGVVPFFSFCRIRIFAALVVTLSFASFGPSGRKIVVFYGLD